MIYKVKTKKINDQHYVCGCNLKSEYGTPDFILEIERPIDLEWFDEYGRLQWVLEKRPDFDEEQPPSKDNSVYMVVQKPQTPLQEEVTLKNRFAINKKISENILLYDLIQAVIAFKNGDSSLLNTMAQKIQEIESGA
jgi:hypothetical protein